MGQALRRGFPRTPQRIPKCPMSISKETQCQRHSAAPTVCGARRGPEEPLAWGVQTDTEPARPAGSCRVWAGRRVRGARQASGVRPSAQSARRPPLETAGWVGGRHPSPQTTGHQLQGNRQREAGSPDGGGRVVGTDAPARLRAALPMACRLCTLSWASGASDTHPPAPSPRLLPSVSYQSPDCCQCPGAPSSERQHVLSCPKPPGPGAVQRAGR